MTRTILTRKTPLTQLPKHLTPISPRHVKSIGISLSLLALSACATQPPPPPPPAPIVQAPPPVVQTLPEPVVQQQQMAIPKLPVEDKMRGALVRSAAAHASVMQAVNTAHNTPITSADNLNANMDALTAVFSPRLGPGMTSYGALVAAQNSQFVDSVVDQARLSGLDSVAYQLYSDPNYAATLPGAAGAASDVSAAWNADISLLASAAAQVKQQSYDLQKDPAWKKQRADDRKSRITAVKNAKNIRRSIGTAEMRDIAAAGAISSTDYDGPVRAQGFWRAFGKSSAPQNYGTSSASYMSPSIKKALTLAALEALGATGPDSSTWIQNYMTAPVLNQCTNWARLHTEQCIAAGHYKYEDAFCMAEHQLADASECLQKAL